MVSSPSTNQTPCWLCLADTSRPGSGEIRQAYERLLADRPAFTPGKPRPTLRVADLALTSTVLADGTVTAEVARLQDDGTWLWAIDQPSVLP